MFSFVVRNQLPLQRRYWINSARLFQQFFKNSKSTEASRDYATEVNIELGEVYKAIRLEKCPDTVVQLDKKQAIKLYTNMARIRRLEHIANILYKEKIIRGFCHLYTGQEAVAAGMFAALRPKDQVITAYRCHGWCLMYGLTMVEILAELAGREAGCQRGKGGSMHMYGKNFYGGNGIVGAQIPLGAGIGLACLYKGDKSVSVALCGDGAANQGQVQEAYNIACLKKLPVIFVIENNNYGMGTIIDRSSCSVEFYKRGFPLPGIYVDGMDVLAVRAITGFAIDFVLHEGPIIVEAHTYRYFGHSMSDPGISYRKREEIQEVRQKRDPIQKFKQVCLKEGLATEEELKKIDLEARKEVDAAATAAKNSKEVPLKELWADVYAENYEPGIRGTTGIRNKHFRVGKTMPKDKISITSKPIKQKDAPAKGKADAAPKPADKEETKGDKEKGKKEAKSKESEKNKEDDKNKPKDPNADPNKGDNKHKK